MPQKNYSPVITTKTQNNYTIKNPYAFRTYMSAMTVLTTNEFKLHGKANIRIEKLNIIRDSDQELLRTSNSITYPTSTLVLDPYDTIYIDLESDNPEVEVGIVVLFVLSTDPLPVGYAVEPENQSEIRSLFSNVGGASLLMPDIYREDSIEYANLDMMGYKDAYITIKLMEAAERGSLHLGALGDPNEWFKNYYQAVIVSQRGEAENNSDRIYFYARYGTTTDYTTRISEITNARILIRKAGLPDFETSCTVTLENLYREIRILMVNDDPIPENMRDAPNVEFIFGLDDTNVSGGINVTRETIATDNLETGRAALGLEVNTGNETWDPIAADQTNPLFVSDDRLMQTISLGIISGIILPSGNNLLRLVLTTTGRAKVQVTAIRV